MTDRSKDGLTPSLLLEAVRDKVRSLLDTQYECEKELFLPMQEGGDQRSCYSREASTAQSANWLSEWFKKNLFPVLTPLAIDPRASVSLHTERKPCVRRAACPRRGRKTHEGSHTAAFAGGALHKGSREERKSSSSRLRSVIEHNMKSLFPGFEVEDKRNLPGDPRQPPRDR